MTSRDLLEMASLDAMGLLDDEERREFEQAFRQSSPAMQAQVRREQNRLTDLEASLPQVEPPASLRERVLARVRDAMEAMAGSRAAGVVGRVAPAEWRLTRNVSPLWRAACIGFATATVVLLATGFNMRDRYENALVAFRDRDLADLVTQRLGPSFVDKLLSPASVKVGFRPASSGFSGRAVILIDEASLTSFLVCEGLPVQPGNYRLVVLNGDGEVAKTLATFESNGGLRGWPVDATVQADAPLAILPPGAAASFSEAEPVLYSL